MLGFQRRFAISSAIAVSVFSAATATAGIVVTAGSVDVFAQTLSGRRGSVDGPITVDPPAQQGTSGALIQSVQSEAGPVPPSEPPSYPLPGTEGVVVVQSYGLLQFSPAGRDLTIGAALAVTDDFSGMDGGSYGGWGNSNFSAGFVVEYPTQFTLTGDLDWSDNDLLAMLRLYGMASGTVVIVVRSESNGPVNFSGLLQPDTYYLETGVTVNEVPLTNVGDFSKNGAVDLTLTLTPNAPQCPGDTNGDHSVDLSDLSSLLSGYGTLSNAALSQGDVDGDGDVDLSDLTALLSSYGLPC